MLTTFGPFICSGDNFLIEIVSTPFSSFAFTESRSRLSGNRNCLQNFPYDRSRRCQDFHRDLMTVACLLPIHPRRRHDQFVVPLDSERNLLQFSKRIGKQIR
ncbi:hypothetical protein Ccrd_017495 [Cynara cardunculus var. scolymus]|uniref:Uncharacterized protein n=1 Tax=Cynara cardunculus var. scolymus TaxID=59895 RepID=A0A103Y7Z8_CYNCS|nr:hypothetical protein Ccrd_017495 [Cynara cardunculus var. scolymus]